MKKIILPKFKLTLAYDGTRYGGWQVQPNSQSIQEHLEKALATALRTPTSATGAGRTDAGVHALGQVAHFSSAVPFDSKKLHASLNGLLPHDIRILSLAPAPEDFHARYSATGKIYRYHLCLDPVQSPFTALYRTHIPYPLDLNALKKSARAFIGTHDFTSFSNEAHAGSASKNATRTLRRLDIVEEEGGIYLEFEGDGFLYKMVRNIVGTQIDIARGKLALDLLPEIFKAKDRRRAGPAAPPHGLFLVKVEY